MSDNVKRDSWLALDAYAFTAKPKITQTALIPAGDDGYGTGDLLELIDDTEDDDVTLFEVIPGILGQADTYALPVDEPAAPVAEVATDGGLFPILAALVAAEGMLF